jgi:hypothetical protein
MIGSRRQVYSRPAEKNAHASGDMGRTYLGDDHRDDRRLCEADFDLIRCQRSM